MKSKKKIERDLGENREPIASSSSLSLLINKFFTGLTPIVGEPTLDNFFLNLSDFLRFFENVKSHVTDELIEMVQ